MPISFTIPALANTAQIGANQSALQTAARANGDCVVAWERTFGGPKNVFFQRFDVAGNPVGATSQVTNPANQAMALRDIAVTDDGAFSILTQGSVSNVIFDPRLLVSSLSDDTGLPTTPPMR